MRLLQHFCWNKRKQRRKQLLTLPPEKWANLPDFLHPDKYSTSFSSIMRSMQIYMADAQHSEEIIKEWLDQADTDSVFAAKFDRYLGLPTQAEHRDRATTIGLALTVLALALSLVIFLASCSARTTSPHTELPQAVCLVLPLRRKEKGTKGKERKKGRSTFLCRSWHAAVDAPAFL